MAPKGGGKGAPQADVLKGRKLISGQRYVGSISEWHSTWGWIEPLDMVNHPQSKKNKGRIYVNRTDARGYVKMEVGAHLDFKIYCDARGLGAVDCTPVQRGAIEAAAKVTEAAEEEALPEGWEKHWSSENEEYFYWNRLTKQTSWLPPAPADEENGEEEIPLPAGWTKHYDEENQEWYYWNKKEKRASWERPEEPAAAEPPAKKAKHAAETSGEDAPVLGQQHIKGRIAEWHGIFGWIVPSQDLSPDLKPLLLKSEGKIYVNWRDVQPGVEAKANMEVEFMLHEDDNGLAASDVGPVGGSKKSAGKTAGVASKLASKWAEEDAAMDDPEEDEENDDANDGPLMPGWDQHWSDEHECYYYWHKATKVACWERPTMPAGDDEEEEDEAAEQDRVWDGEGSEGGASYMATPQTPFVSRAGRDMTPTTPVSSQGRIPTNHTVRQSPAAPPRRNWGR